MTYIAPTDDQLHEARRRVVASYDGMFVRPILEVIETECFSTAASWNPEKGWYTRPAEIPGVGCP